MCSETHNISRYSTITTENCGLSSQSLTHEVVQKISNIAHEYGDVTVFKVYADLKMVITDQRRTELHCAGVALTDCPHNGLKNVVDNTLIGAV